MSSLYFQAKVKTLRQLYEKARLKMKRSGQSASIGTSICPYFEELDRFLGSRPLTEPHYQVTSQDTTDEIPSSNDEQQLEQENVPPPPDEGDHHSDNDAEVEFTAPRGRVTTPGKEKRRKKRQTLAADVTNDLQSLISDDAEFRKEQQNLWKEHLELQKEHLQSRKEDRDLMRNWMQAQTDQNNAMTNMMKDLINVMKPGYRPTSAQPTPYDYQYSYNAPAPAAETSGLGYAGAGNLHYAAESPYDDYHNL